MKIHATVVCKDSSNRVLLTNIRYLAGEFRDHCWVKERYTNELRKVPNGTTVVMDADPYRYDESKLSLCNIANIREIDMKCIASTVKVSRKLTTVMIVLTIPQKYKLNDVDSAIEDNLEIAEQHTLIIGTNHIAVGRTITIVLETESIADATSLKNIYMQELSDDFCNAIDILSFRTDKKLSDIVDIVDENLLIQVKLPKNLHKCFKVNSNIRSIGFAVGDQILTFTREDLALDGRQLRVAHIRHPEDETQDAYLYIPDPNKEPISIYTEVASVIIIKKMATYNTSHVLHTDNVVSFAEGAVVTKIADREITVKLDTIKKHGTVFEAKELENNMFYDVSDPEKTPIPTEILKLHSIKVT